MEKYTTTSFVSEEMTERTRHDLLEGALSFDLDRGYCLKRVGPAGKIQWGTIPVLAALDYDFSILLEEEDGVLDYDTIEDLLSDGWILD